MLLLLLLLLLIVDARRDRKLNGVMVLVQSAARNFSDLKRNFDLKGPGEMYFSDLDDGEDDDEDGSGYEVTDGVTY